MRVRPALLPLAVCLLAAGCTAGTGEPPAEPEGTFALPTEAEITCLEHQEQPPGVAYTGGVDADTAAIFTMLRYWASNGDKPYCDGEPPTAVDVQWRDVVEDLGAAHPPDPPGVTPSEPDPSEPDPSGTVPEPTTT